MPKVDVIIPAYNSAKFLPIALDSVITQTFEDWRIVLVDDGSTDDIAGVVSRYADRLGAKLTFLQQPNAGVSAARNTAIRNSSSEFIALLDADDVWLPRRLEASLEYLSDRTQVGLCYGFISRIDAHGYIVDTFTTPSRHPEGHIAPYIYMRSMNLPAPTITFRRRCVEDVGLFDESMRATEDRDLWVRIALRYEVGLIREVIAHYRMSPQSATTDPGKMLKSQLHFVRKHYGSPGCGIRARRVALGWIYRQRAEALSHRQQPWDALGSALRALSFYPFETNNMRTAVSLFLRCAYRGVR